MPETLESAEPTINALDELSALDRGEPLEPKTADKPSEKPAAATKKEAPKTPDKATDKPLEKPAAKVEDKPKADAPKPDAAKPTSDKVADKTPSPANENNIKSLRESRDRFEKESKSLAEENKSLKAQLSSREPSKEHTELVAAKDKTIRELQSRLAEHDYTQSEEYQNQHYKPYVSTWTRALQSIMALKGRGADGNPFSLGKEDVETLLLMPESRMLDEARKIFGDENLTALTLLTTHKNRIVEAHEKMQEARTNAQKILDDKRSKQAEADETSSKQRAKMWQDKNAEIVESDPVFKPDESDPESGTLLEKGYAEVDKAFSDDPSITPEQRIEAHARLRHQAAAYHRLKAMLAARDERIAAQDEELKGFRESEPTAEKTAKKSETGATTFKSIEQELEELDRKSR